MEDVKLDWLYEQYTALVTQYATIKKRLESVTNTIISYGGTVPGVADISHEELSSIISSVSENVYPKKGTWKEKILFTLKRMGRPATATEVQEYIFKSEQQAQTGLMLGNISNVVTVTMSKMGVDGELEVDKSQHKNKYSLIS